MCDVRASLCPRVSFMSAHEKRASDRTLLTHRVSFLNRHLPKAGQHRVEREAWQLDVCPLLQEHELSAAAVVSPCVVVEVRGGAFAAAGNDLGTARALPDSKLWHGLPHHLTMPMPMCCELRGNRQMIARMVCGEMLLFRSICDDL